MPFLIERERRGRDKRRLSATVALTSIVCEDGFLIFNLGEILCKSTS